MTKVTILRRTPLKESPIPINASVPIREVLFDTASKMSALQDYTKFLTALDSNLPRVLLCVSHEAGIDISANDVERVKLLQGDENPIAVLRDGNKGTAEGLIDYEGLQLKFELKGRELRFEMLNRR